MPAMPVANELSERCERGGALTSAQGRDTKGGVVLI
jgi:hypothetical protein